jgi:hypothetical protein
MAPSERWEENKGINDTKAEEKSFLGRAGLPPWVW